MESDTEKGTEDVYGWADTRGDQVWKSMGGSEGCGETGGCTYNIWRVHKLEKKDKVVGDEVMKKKFVAIYVTCGSAILVYY